jgi:hypothetical protein
VHGPFADAGISIYNSNSGTAAASGTTTVGSTELYSPAITVAGIVESTEPVLLYSHSSQSGNGDGLVSYPPTLRPLYGIHSNQYYYSPIADGADIGVFCSGGASATSSSVARGSQNGNDICTGAAVGTGDAVMVVPTTVPVAAIQQADGGGGESSSFLPTPEFGTRYILPIDTDYVSIVCAPRFGTSTIEVQDSSGTMIDSGSCNVNGEFPGALNFTPGGSYSQGYQVVSTDDVPFYMYYQDNGLGDESNTWSAVQAKKFNSLYIPSTFGAQEENEEAQYEQLNYRWYENTNAITPSTPWDIDGSPVAEGTPIADQGAVNPGDELRLRMNLLANNGTGTVDSAAFTLQYAQAETCSSVVGNSWRDLGDVGSTTAAFAGLNNAAVGDGTALSSTLLSDSDVNGSYEEEKN